MGVPSRNDRGVEALELPPECRSSRILSWRCRGLIERCSLSSSYRLRLGLRSPAMMMRSIVEFGLTHILRVCRRRCRCYILYSTSCSNSVLEILIPILLSEGFQTEVVVNFFKILPTSLKFDPTSSQRVDAHTNSQRSLRSISNSETNRSAHGK